MSLRRAESVPLSKISSAIYLEIMSTPEVAFLTEMVRAGRIDGSELLRLAFRLRIGRC